MWCPVRVVASARRRSGLHRILRRRAPRAPARPDRRGRYGPRSLLRGGARSRRLGLDGDEATGANIVKVALEAPLKQIAINAGLEGGVVAEKVRGLNPGWGLNAATGEYVDLIKDGIIDPAKVTRSALQNAASIAALFLTTEAVIADKPEKAGPAMPGGDGGMGGMDF